MDSLRINTYRPQYSYRYNPAFQGGLKSLNDLNPISRYSDRYFRRVAQESRKFIQQIIPELKNNLDVIPIRSTKKITISAWDIKPNNSDQYVLFLHGMSQNVSNYQSLYKQINQQNIGIFAVEYRGYGANHPANFSEDKLRHDVEVAYKYLTEKKGIKPENITVIGHSMGGALATNFASNHPDLKSLILICPIVNAAKIGEKFALNKTLGEGIPPSVKAFTTKLKPLNWLYSLRLSSLLKMKSNKVPTYIIQSKNDVVTPLGSARTLAKVAKRQGVLQDIKVLESGGHMVNSNKVNIIGEFLDRIYSK